MGSQPRGISASRGAAILGLSEWSTPFEVWQEILEERSPGFNARKGYVLPERKEGPPLRWGTAFEDSVIQLAENAQGKKITFREFFFSTDGTRRFVNSQEDPNSCFITCHIDGWYSGEFDSYGQPLHEGKTTSAFPFREKWGEPGTARIPRTYQVQVQHQMACTGAEMDIVSVLVFPETPDHFEKLGIKVVSSGDWWLEKWDEQKEDSGLLWRVPVKKWAEVFEEMGYFHQYPVPADHDAQKLLLDAYRHFWDHYVIGEKEPEPRDYDDLKRMFPEPKKTIVCDSNMSRWIAEYKSCGEETGENSTLKRRQKHLKMVILNRARKSEKIEDDDSLDALIFRDQAGNKLASYSKDKRGTYTFRAS